MLLSGYRKRLEADLVNWTQAGLLLPDQAAAIRRASDADSGLKLSWVFAMLGGLLLSAGVIAFVAANWQGIPRVAKLGGTIAAVVASISAAWALDRRGLARATDAAATCAALLFGAGVALVGQMYHLPADWPAGALMVGIGALAVAALMRSDGALIIALASGAAWLFTSHAASGGKLPPLYLVFLLPAFLLAVGRQGRAVHHAAVLALGLWLVLVAAGPLGSSAFGSQLAYALALAIASTAIGVLALDRGWSPLFSAFLPWGLAGYVMALAAQLARIFDPWGGAGAPNLPLVIAGVAAVVGIGLLYRLSRDKRSGLLLVAALATAAAIPLLFWSGIGFLAVGRILVAALVLTSACLMVAAGATSGLRRVSLAGTAAFGLNVLVLLYVTVGSLLGQAVFFFVGGIALIGFAVYAHRVLARLVPAETGGGA
jgi:uncharacterized membrane protein